jgi:uncharacterized protein YoxC
MMSRGISIGAMDQDLLLKVMAGFVVLTAIAMVAQAVTLVMLYRGFMGARDKVLGVLPAVERVTAMVSDLKPGIDKAIRQTHEVIAKGDELLDSVNGTVREVREGLADFKERATYEMERTSGFVSRSTDKIENTIDAVQSGVLRPIREVHGLTAGVKKFVSTLVHRR